MAGTATIRERVSEIIAARYGRREENLMASGLIDSLRAVELAGLLEKEFGLATDTFALKDMRTISSISSRVQACSRE